MKRTKSIILMLSITLCINSCLPSGEIKSDQANSQYEIKNKIPQQVNDFLKSKYSDPVITETSLNKSSQIIGLKIYSVYDHKNANEDPLIPDSWIYTGKKIIPGREILEALKEVEFEPVDEENARTCALIILSVNRIYIKDYQIEVLKKNRQFIVFIKGNCSQSHPFFRNNDWTKCNYRITLGNKEYTLISE